MPEVGKRCLGLVPIICPIRRQRRSITCAVLLGAQHLPAMFSLSGSLFPTHGWVRRHPLGHHNAGVHRQRGTHRGRVIRPAPLRRADIRQDHTTCHRTQYSRGHTCPRRTALEGAEPNRPGPAALDCRRPYTGPLTTNALVACQRGVVVVCPTGLSLPRLAANRIRVPLALWLFVMKAKTLRFVGVAGGGLFVPISGPGPVRRVQAVDRQVAEVDHRLGVTGGGLFVPVAGLI
jgi:hypothetical protein